ncbi:hypothetical protein MLD38_031585 [Melastoma candidum]|uniref:Uncharacterized protein n=1 Tax=Melastoma candidum TaxID=119954 RepID=A0ACB9MS01_9MYRT|nr:hypothetical protein MLD38_031585 [Melastoma candidum]
MNTGRGMHPVGSFGSGDMRGCPVLESANEQSNTEEGCPSGSANGRFPSLLQDTLLKKMGAEFIGTFMLIFAATATSIVNQKSKGAETLLGLAASTGLAVMVVILATGHISGAHLNPAVTISFAALNSFPWRHVSPYISAQLTASLCAAFVLEGIFYPTMGGGVTTPSTNYYRAFALELIISFNLMFVTTAMATDTQAVGGLSGIAVGATVTLNILIAGPTTGASMNPVRTLGPAIATGNYTAIWIYLTAPVIGALLGAATYAAVRVPNCGGGSSEEHRRRRP